MRQATSTFLWTRNDKSLRLAQILTGQMIVHFFALFDKPSVVNAECGQDFCAGLICQYGRAYDSSGCVQCDCSYPCEDIQCPSDEQCQPIRVNECDGIRCPMYTGICTPGLSTKVPCRAVSCPSGSCRFGFKEVNGCSTCECHDPCKSYCPTGFKCLMSADGCQPGVECRDSPMPYCEPDSQSSTPASTTAEPSKQTRIVQGSPAADFPSRLQSTSSSVSMTTSMKPKWETTFVRLITAKLATLMETKTQKKLAITLSSQPSVVESSSGSFTTLTSADKLTSMSTGGEYSSALGGLSASPLAEDRTIALTNDTWLADGTVRVQASYDVIDSMKSFRQQIQRQISTRLGVRKNSINITDIKPGSAIIFFSITAPWQQFDAVLLRALDWQANDTDFHYKGLVCPARLISFKGRHGVTISVFPTTTITTTTSSRPESVNILFLIILVSILAPVSIAAIACTTLAVCKYTKYHRKREWTAFSHESSVVNGTISSKLDFESSRKLLSNDTRKTMSCHCQVPHQPETEKCYCKSFINLPA